MNTQKLILSVSLIALLAACAGQPAVRDINGTPEVPSTDTPQLPLDVPTTINPDLIQSGGLGGDVDTNKELGELLLTVHFDLNKDTINTADAQALLALTKKLEANPTKLQQFNITIQGHTDIRGTDAINDALSGRRASAVLNQLRRNSTALTNQKIEAVGQGSHYLLKQGNTEADHAANRRAEVRLVGKLNK